MAYMTPITNKFLKEVPASLKIIKSYPVNKPHGDASTFGFKIDKETARRLATQILIACETNEEIKIYHNKDTKICWVMNDER